MSETKTPMWFWIVALVFFFWNLVGAYFLYAQLSLTPEQISNLPELEQHFSLNSPSWAIWVWAGAVGSAVLTSLMLLLRQSLAVIFSFISILFLMAHTATWNIVASKGPAVPTAQIFFVMFVVVMAIFLCFLALTAKSKGWLK